MTRRVQNSKRFYKMSLLPELKQLRELHVALRTILPRDIIEQCIADYMIPSVKTYYSDRILKPLNAAFSMFTDLELFIDGNYIAQCFLKSNKDSVQPYCHIEVFS